MSNLDYEKVTNFLLEWLDKQIAGAGKKGGIVGLSGGIDSAVTAALLQRLPGLDSFGLIMPCHSSLEDGRDAELIAEFLEMEYDYLDLSPHYDRLIADLRKVEPGEDQLAEANVKPRLRMISLYYLAARKNFLVVGTDNWSELTTGYFTKYGDGGIDLAPLGRLVKTEVRELARHLGLPEKIISREPSAGLWRDQTDEGEMGISYEILDKYILGEEVGETEKARIEELKKSARHKLQMPPVPDRTSLEKK